VETYVVLRRSGWPTAQELKQATARSATEVERMADYVASIHSYVLEERERRIGTLCICRAASPEALRRHADAALLPIDEIIKVTDTVIVRSDRAAEAV
jgi:sporulation protein YlmC with PRC-barrel domain